MGALKSSAVSILIGAGCAFANPSYANSTELNVWIRASNDSLAVYKKLAEKFEEKTGIAVRYFNATTDFEQRIARAAAGRNLPDLVFNDSAALGQMLQMGIIEQVHPEEIAGHADVEPLAWDSAKAYDGNYYAVPTSSQAFALFIRKDWREKLGLPIPKTWEDLYKLADAFTNKDPDGNGKADTFGFSLTASTQRGYASWFLTNYIWQAGGDFVEKNGDGYKSILNSEKTASALDYIRNLYCAGYTQPGAINATTADIIPSFRSGQTGIFLSGPYHIALFDKEPGRDKIEVIAPPTGPAGPDGITSLAEGTSVYFMKGSKNSDAAKKFIEYVITPEAQIVGMAADTDNLPIVRLPINMNVNVKDVYNDERWSLFEDIYKKKSQYIPSVPNWSPIRASTADIFNKILSDCDSNIEKYLEDADKQINTELKKQKAFHE